jgi:5-methylcytosine-specific restriction enzyme subunit McrC
MAKPDSIKVFEHSPLTYKEGRKGYHASFTEKHYHAFERFFSENERTPYFELIPYGVRFTSYVGAIHIGMLSIEVLPKAGRDGSPEVWQAVLLDMLKTCSLLTARATGEAPLRLKANAILDLYFELFIRELEQLLHQGLIKRYRKTDGQTKALKGALLFAQHASKNAVHRERFYTRHTTYDADHLIHRILHEALLLVERIASGPLLTDHIGRIRLDFPELPRMKVQAAHFDRITYTRKTESYRRALDIAKLLLLNFRPDLSTGQQDMLALMFDMNTLWEEYVYRILHRHYQQDFQISAQRQKRFWEQKSIRPDIVITSRQDPAATWVVDTKWKVIDPTHPADEDLRQMYVYNQHWDARRSLLLYPRTRGQADKDGTYQLSWKDAAHDCTLGFVDVLAHGKLNPGLAGEVMGKLNVFGALKN